MRFWPNLFVVAFATGLAALLLIWGMPPVIAKAEKKFWLIASYIFVIICLGMFLWCWLYTSTSNPGRVEDDLRERGLLRQIQQGDIPFCIQHLKICRYCNLPIPPHGGHCKDCGCCYNRLDHHCGVTGQCIGDRNFKAFILSFFYASILGVSFLIAGILTILQSSVGICTGIVTLYGSLLGIMLFGFGVSFFISHFNEITPIGSNYPKSVCFKMLIKSFGAHWWQRLIPIQNESTKLAWPGIDWRYGERLL